MGDLKLVNINDERFWDILFDEACVEGQQATRIRNELEKIIAYDVEKVVADLEEVVIEHKESVEFFNEYGIKFVTKGKAIEIVRNGGKE